MPERAPPPTDLSGLSLDAIAALAAAQAIPPVAAWNPPHCGDSRMRIAADGRWFHEGRPIERPALVRLFASVLRRETDGSYALVTPAEKLAIAIDDLPFLAVEASSEGAGPDRRIAFRLSVGTVVTCDAAHPIRVTGSDASPRPELVVRPGLAARIGRAAWLHLAELALALAEGETEPALWSNGVRFPLVPTAA